MTSDGSLLRTRIQSLIDNASIPGVSVATLLEGRVEILPVGFKQIGGNDAVDGQTVFDAASLTKPLVAYAVLQLVDAGVLDLDAPLAGVVAPIVPGDPASAAITARHVLTHTPGLANLRGKEPLRMHFAPGAWFSYSSVGFTYLQSAVEAITREPLEATVRRLVFEPLGMQSSSLEWQARFEHNMTASHEGAERLDKHRPPMANASYSLQTTASDYIAFVGAVLAGTALKARTWREWLTPAVRVPRGEAVRLEGRPPALEANVAWGLGWGLEPSQGTFFQWGKMTGARAFVMGSVEQQAGVVMLANSNRGLRLMNAVVDVRLTKERPAVRWLEACVGE